MKKETKAVADMFSIVIAIPKKYSMPDAMERLDKEMNKIRNNILSDLAKKRGIKLQWLN